MLAKEIFSDQNNFINITGVPGAGKTTLAVQIAELSKQSNVLYLSFGKENTLKVRQRLAGKATCLSFHAFAKNGMNINSQRIVNRVTLSLINQCTKNTEHALHSAKELECIMVMLEMFCKSNLKLEVSHKLLDKKDTFPKLTKEDRDRVNNSFLAYWRSLWNEKSNLPITHDMYLKEFSLKKISIPYTTILVDESQDLNDTMHELINKIYLYNKKSKIISFGDPCQQIFSFRGSSRRFLEADFHYKLTKSYRFGSNLASLCNAFMNKQELHYYTDINSDGKGTEIIKSPPILSIIDSIKSGKRPVLISRFNYTLWQVLKECCENKIKCALLGGISNAEFDFLRALNQLYNGNKVRHTALVGMKYIDYKRIAKATNDRSSLLACRFVESVGNNAELFNRMKNSVVSLKDAQVLLTTVHQAKGLEFNDAILLGDFPEVYDTQTKDLIKIKDEEAHLLYTAMSRAKKTLGIPTDLFLFYKTHVKK